MTECRLVDKSMARLAPHTDAPGRDGSEGTHLFDYLSTRQQIAKSMPTNRTLMLARWSFAWIRPVHPAIGMLDGGGR